MSGRKVYVSSDMSVDERLLQVSEKNGLASLLWPWLLTALNDWGRCEAAPLRLKARIWPMNDAVSVALISEALDLFAEVELIECYSVDGRAYLRVPPPRWWKWQTHIHRAKREEDKSRIPAPEAESARKSAPVISTPRGRAESRGIARDSVPSPSPSPSPTPSLTDEQGRFAERECAQAQGSPVAKAADAARSLVAPAPASASSSASHPATPASGARMMPLHPAVSTTLTTHTARVPDPVWDACIAAMGAAPSNRVERGKWAKGIQALKESLATDGSPPTEIVVRSTRYRTRFGPSVPLNPMALAGNWTTLATDIPQTGQAGQEGQRHGSFTQGSGQRSTSGAYGRRAGAAPKRFSPEYYAQAAARAGQDHQSSYTGYTGGATSEGRRDAVVG